MSEKFCIFCGKRPENKNLEHVIPQWLIRMTGREKKNIYAPHPDLGRDIGFLNFSFPACTECNSKFSRMEAAVKPVLERVLSGQSISGADASLLMDWFDKIRIGLWLSNMCYDPKLKHDVNPHYFIETGVAKKDRMLSIQKLNLKPDANKGIYCGGTMTRLFNYCPIAFTMVINDYYFFNASTHNLVSPRVGFPIITHAEKKNSQSGELVLDIENNKHKKVSNPIVRTFTPGLNALTFYQPIYRDFLTPENDFPIDDYMSQHSYDIASGLGGVFVQNGFAHKAKYLEQSERIGIKLKPCALPNLESDVLKFQNAIQSQSVISNYDTNFGVKLNKIMLDSMQNQK